MPPGIFKRAQENDFEMIWKVVFTKAEFGGSSWLNIEDYLKAPLKTFSEQNVFKGMSPCLGHIQKTDDQIIDF